MAKKKRKKSKKRSQRDVRNIANHSVLRPLIRKEKYYNEPVSDRRKYHPNYRPLTIAGLPAEITLTDSKAGRNLRTKARITFKDAKNVMVCRRRKERRKSLFASGGIGGGKKIKGRRRITEDSKIKC